MTLEPRAVCEFQLALRHPAELVHIIIVDFVNYFITKTIILTLVWYPVVVEGFTCQIQFGVNVCWLSFTVSVTECESFRWMWTSVTYFSHAWPSVFLAYCALFPNSAAWCHKGPRFYSVQTFGVMLDCGCCGESTLMWPSLLCTNIQ